MKFPKLTLYDELNNHSTVGCTLENEVFAALKPIFDHYVDLGYNPRELAHHIHGTTTIIELSAIHHKRLEPSSRPPADEPVKP
jgi:hypothetical protein